MKTLHRLTALLIAAAAFILLAGCSSIRVANERAVSVDEVIKMSQAGVDKDVIISQLETTYSRFKLTTDDIVRLTEAGVNKDVIQSMVESGSAPDPFSWEYGWTPYDNWINYYDYYGYYNGYMYHYPYYSTFIPYMYMTPYVTYREPGLVGRFYHYAPLGGWDRPYYNYWHRRDSGRDDNTGEKKER